MGRRQFLISVLPGLWEWLAPAGIAFLVVVEVGAAHLGWLPVWLHVAVQVAVGLPLVWLSVAHATDSHLRRRMTIWRDLSGMLTMMVLSAVLLSGNGRLLLSRVPNWLESFHRGSVIMALLALLLHLALAPRGRGVRRGGYLFPFAKKPVQPTLLTKRPLLQSNMSLTQVMMIFLDHLRDNRMVDSISYARNGDQITCQFKLCPFAEKCPLPRDKQLACQHLCMLAQETLAQGGYPVKVIPAVPTEKTAQVAFHLQLLPKGA